MILSKLYPWVCILKARIEYLEFKKRLKEEIKEFETPQDPICRSWVKTHNGIVLKAAVVMNSSPTAIIVFLTTLPEDAHAFATRFNEIAEVDLRIGELDYTSE
ncbi:hypothetical protein [Candidatus Pyrohabitans sp.]